LKIPADVDELKPGKSSDVWYQEESGLVVEKVYLEEDKKFNGSCYNLSQN